MLGFKARWLNRFIVPSDITTVGLAAERDLFSRGLFNLRS
jgi:hypothetical protein